MTEREGSDHVADDVRILVEQRRRARAAGDYAAADEIRERIRAAGFDVADTSAGPVVAPLVRAARPAPRARRSTDVPTVLDRPAGFEVSVHWLVEGWPEDVTRGIESFRRFEGGASVQHVVVEAVEADAVAPPKGVEVVPMAPEAGWAGLRNAGLRRSSGEVVVVMDGSVEATGDVLTPLRMALADSSVGVTGPFGIVTEDLHDFHDSPGPEVDAVEGYLMAFRRDLLIEGLRFDEKFVFYRTADIELSFQIKARGLRATVTPVPVVRHVHRRWSVTPPDERDRLSKRNYYRFLDRWRGRFDLTVAGADPGHD